MNSKNNVIANALKDIDWYTSIFGNFTLPFAEALPYLIKDVIATPKFMGNTVIFLAYLIGAEWTSVDRKMVFKFFCVTSGIWNLFSLFNY